MTRYSPRRLGASAVVLAAALMFAAPAFADDTTAPAPALPPPVATPLAPEAQMLGRHIVGQSISHLDALRPYMSMIMAVGQAKMKAEADKKGGAFLVMYTRFSPWMQFFDDAMFDEFTADRPKFERIIGDWLAEKYTVEQLQAVSDLLDSPATSELFSQMAADMPSMMASKKTPDFTWSPEAKVAIAHFNASAGGRGFIARSKAMKDFDKDPETVNMFADVIAAYIPGVAKRWGEKAEAAEDARTAALAAATAAAAVSH